jgi:hypothetical protein
VNSRPFPRDGAPASLHPVPQPLASRTGETATRSMLVERRKRAAYLGGESAFATCARSVGGYFERDLVHRRVHGRVRPWKLAAVRVRRDVHRVHSFEELVIRVSATRPRPPTREWCQPVLVLNLPNSRSTRERADGQAERLLLARTGLRCRHGRAAEGVACGRPRMRSRPRRRLSPRPDGEDRERRRSPLVFDGRRALSCTR